ncbi:MAG TPA: FAD-dependent oxidoreductase [Ktedonobacteraceae bacterium]|nr:FAD-dependent oxidoreductase [Ktedonobacteraceae bacterium]
MTTHNMTTEILMIGGGITGTSTAYFLAQAGHEVILNAEFRYSCVSCSRPDVVYWFDSYSLVPCDWSYGVDLLFASTSTER